jgi:hypothetical protein
MPESAYRLVLIAFPGGTPALVRLRQALKTLLRIHRLRCQSVEELETSGAASSTSASPGGTS